MRSVLCSRSSRVTVATLIGLILAACDGGGEPAQQLPVTAAQLDGLPLVGVTDGASLCIGGTEEDTACPSQAAVGNWLGDNIFAVWETGRAAQLWDHGKKILLVSRDTLEENQYRAVTSVGPTEQTGEVILVDALSAVAHRFRIDGTHLGIIQLPQMSALSIWGYYGAIPVWQAMETAPDQVTANVVIRVGKGLGDSTAKELFHVNLPWLHLINGSVTVAPPLFPNSVLYAFDQNGDVIWSDGMTFALERDRADGKPVWQVTSSIKGPAVDSVDIANKRAILSSPTNVTIPPDQLDSMVAKSAGTVHPALNGIMLAPAGDILVARTVLPQRDSIDYIRFTGAGTPTDRFTLPKADQPVLFAGDSLLVHRQLLGVNTKTLMWLHITAKK